jgi:DsbC/DsbD-like thiol-disulfide interchange protein
MIPARLLNAVALTAAYRAAVPGRRAMSAKSIVTTERVRAELMAHAPDGLTPGKPVWVGLQLAHQPEWHTYWKNSGDSGLPTQLQWTLPPGVLAGDIDWPVPRKIRSARWPTTATRARCCCRFRSPSRRTSSLRCWRRHGGQAQGQLAGMQEGMHP